MTFKCIVPSCTNNTAENWTLSFFRIPKDEIRRVKWLTNINREDLLEKTPVYCYNNFRVCMMHFESEMFSNVSRNRLHIDAEPVKNLNSFLPLSHDRLITHVVSDQPEPPQSVFGNPTIIVDYEQVQHYDMDIEIEESTHTEDTEIDLDSYGALTSSSYEENIPITTLKEARRFMTDCFKAVGTPQEHADIIADSLLEADYRGHYSHGMNRLDLYINDILNKKVNPKAVCTIEKETVATALVNGNNGLGAVVGNFCMNLALKKAQDAGIGMVVVHGSNHFGIAGLYTEQAVAEGYIGLSFTNTSPCMVPTGAKDAVLGSNPISLGAPALDGDSFILDMATTTVAVGKIEIQRRKGQPIPEGWALNEQGVIETDSDIAMKASRLMPLGGAEINSGYKGYGLGMLVEILCGILAGSAYGPDIPRWGYGNDVANLGQAFIAIDPSRFADYFKIRLTDLMNRLRNMPSVDDANPVLVAGDKERMHMKKVLLMNGLAYVQNQHESNAKLAEKLKVKPMVSRMVSSKL